jgi:hypothetical protein
MTSKVTRERKAGDAKKKKKQKRPGYCLRLRGDGRQLYAIGLGDNGSGSGLGAFLRHLRARPNLHIHFRDSRNRLLAHPTTRLGRIDAGETAACALAVKRVASQ